MRRRLIAGLALGALAGQGCAIQALPSRSQQSGAPVAAPSTLDPARAADRFAGAERLDDAELGRLLPGMRAVFIAASDERRYRAVVSEAYSARPGVHANRLRGRGAFNALLVTYIELETMGSYRIRGSRVCSILSDQAEEHCRSLFRLSDGAYAFSTFENPDIPALLVRLEPNRSSGR